MAAIIIGKTKGTWRLLPLSLINIIIIWEGKVTWGQRLIQIYLKPQGMGPLNRRICAPLHKTTMLSTSSTSSSIAVPNQTKPNQLKFFTIYVTGQWRQWTAKVTLIPYCMKLFLMIQFGHYRSTHKIHWLVYDGKR